MPLPRILRHLGFATFTLLGVLALLWATGALWYDLPAPSFVRSITAILYMLTSLGLWIDAKHHTRYAVAATWLLILVWWFSQSPQQERPWQPDVARTAWAEIQGDEVTLHNVRRCEYRTATDYTPVWETRTVRLSQITGMDLAVNYWGSPYIAHPIASFQFADSDPVCLSVETRREVGEDYSAIGGFYRQYELIYLVSDERDVIRVRTNIRAGEEVYLYHLKITAEQARARFLEYLTTLNQLHEKPRWYHAVTTNCTTSILTQQPADERLPWDWRLLVNGKGDVMLHELNLLQTDGLDFPELRRRALINSAAQAADTDPNFSRRIRQNRPGFLDHPSGL